MEPVKGYFDRLVENYQGVMDVYFANVAISDCPGFTTLYRLGVDPSEYGFPEWLSQLGSLKEERMGDLWDKYEGRNVPASFKDFWLNNRIKDTVECISFDALVKRYNLSSIDLLQIDAEGSDFDILKAVNFATTQIRFVNYESVLLHERKGDAQRLMEANGYRCIDYRQDTFCYRNNDRFLTRCLINRMKRRAP